MHPQSCSPFSGHSGMSIGEGAGPLYSKSMNMRWRVARPSSVKFFLTRHLATHIMKQVRPTRQWRSAGYAKAMANAGVKPEQIDYVNAHGTGTEANDQIETLAMKKVFSGAENLLISSTKSYFGHNIGAAGIVELIACPVTLPEKSSANTQFFAGSSQLRSGLCTERVS